MGTINDCEYAAPGGICKGNLDVVCVHQDINRRDDQEPELKRVNECYCRWPTVAVDRWFAGVICDLASFLKEKRHDG